jgi:hypothetical protein
MTAPRPVPRLTCHKYSGKAVVRLSGHDHYCGRWGTPEAKATYDRLIAEWLANGRRSLVPVAADHHAISVAEVLVAFWRFAEGHYRDPDGRPTTEMKELRRSLKPVRELYGPTPAAGFGPKKLAAVRQKMIEAGWCRTLINRRVERVRRAFRWAAAEELVPAAVYQAMRTLPGLQKGRTAARESDRSIPRTWRPCCRG